MAKDKTKPRGETTPRPSGATSKQAPGRDEPRSRKALAARKKGGQGGVILLVVAGVLVVALALVAAALLPRGGGESHEGHQGREVAAPEPSLRVGPLEVSATEADLGKVPLDTWVNYTFRLRNASEKPVTITLPREGVETLEGC